MKQYFYRLSIYLLFVCSISCEAKLKVLHLGYHRGIENVFRNVSKELDIELTSWVIGGLPDYFFDPLVQKSASPILYNIGHERAERIWKKHKDFFNSFDVIITSDTAALARIFLQNSFKNHLIIWICNRFDFSAPDFLDCSFPDPEFYELFRSASSNKKVTFINFTPIESIHGNAQGVNTGTFIIKPYGASLEAQDKTLIPSNVNKAQTFFIPNYYNNIKKSHNRFGFNLTEICSKLNIPSYCGPYNGPRDIEDFKGIIHIPYAFSTTSQFENFELGLIHFIPNKALFNLLRKSDKFFFASDYLLDTHLDFVEFYCKEVEPHIVYFSSWKDLATKIDSIDYEKKRAEIKAFARMQKEIMIKRWKSVFTKIEKELISTNSGDSQDFSLDQSKN